MKRINDSFVDERLRWLDDACVHCGQGLDTANITKGHLLDSADFGVAQRRRLFLVRDRKRPLRKTICTHSGPWKSAASILDPVGVWKTPPLFKAGRASATLKRAEHGFQALGEEASFLLVYYGSDGGSWQLLNRPLRTITTLDRFALVQHDRHEPQMRML